MKIIFLDFDGVLQCETELSDEFGKLFYPQFIQNLGLIINKTGSKLVITSSWRKNGINWLKKMWINRKYTGEIIGITEIINENQEFRDKEIKNYINANNIDNYVIIDDSDFIIESEYYIKTKHLNDSDAINLHNTTYGLTYNCAVKAIEILNKNEKVICLLCGQEWGIKFKFTNICENPNCMGFCTFGYENQRKI